MWDRIWWKIGRRGTIVTCQIIIRDKIKQILINRERICNLCDLRDSKFIGYGEISIFMTIWFHFLSYDLKVQYSIKLAQTLNLLMTKAL